MVYVVSIFGFIGGFALGLFLIQFFVKGKTNEELVRDKSLHWKYGAIPWVVAIFAAYSALELYSAFFF